MTPPFDLRLVFDREDRTYRAGGRVTGRVEIRTAQDLASRGVLLRWFWMTEGAGTRDRGIVHEEILLEGPVQAGPARELPFSLPVPPGPFSYRGHLVSLGHHVQARVDLPWSSDREVTEEVVVVPGRSVGLPPAVLARSDSVHAPDSKRTAVTAVGIVTLLAGLTVLAAIGFLLVPIGIALVAVGVWRAVGRAKLGESRLRLSSRVISPGRALEVRLAFRPRKPVTINGAEVKLVCREVAESGSGKSRKVRRHEVYSAPTKMNGPDRAGAEERIELEGVVVVPDRPAYSLATDHNRVEWRLRLQVDIPSWPDFVQEEELILWPAGEKEEQALPYPKPLLRASRRGDPRRNAVPQQPTGSDTASAHVRRSLLDAVDAYRLRRAAAEAAPAASRRRASTSSHAPDPGTLPAAAHSTAPTSASSSAKEPATPVHTSKPSKAAPRSPSASPPAFATALAAILAADRWTGARQHLLDALMAEEVVLDLVVERRERTFGDMEPGFRSGRTVVGKLVDGNSEVVVRFPESRNAEMDHVRRGDALRVRGRVVDWQALFERPLVRAGKV